MHYFFFVWNRPLTNVILIFFLGKKSQNTQIFSNFIDQIMPDFLLYSKIEGVIDQAVPVSAAPYFAAPVSKNLFITK